MRNAVRWFSLFVMGLTGVVGLINASSELGDGASFLQRSVPYATAVYGVLGVIGFVAMLRRRAWAVPVAVCWAIASCYTATVASFAFHDPNFADDGTLFSVLGAGVAMTVIGWIVMRGAQLWAQSAVASPQEPV